MNYIVREIPCLLFRKIPAAAMIIPMFLSIIFNALFPDFVKIGSLTTAIFSKSAVVPLTAAVLFFAGTQLKINEAPAAFKRGGVLLVTKFIVGYAIGTLFSATFGSIGILGISTLAVFTALLSSNGSIYLAIASEYGDDIDLGAYSLLSIKDGPFLTMLALGASGASDIPLMALFATLFPMILGIILGNIWPGVRGYFKGGTKVLIPLVGISVGSSLNLSMMFQAGVGGVILGVVAFAVGGFFLTLADKVILRRPGYAGAGLASVAGSAVATPTIVSSVVPGLEQAAALASVQVAAAVIVTAILCPILCSWTLKRWGAPRYPSETVPEKLATEK
ncbi:2-keto-3-deoxygluconate permease [Megasphaera hominis]|jgi:2-keto-3-deoxygluconate permease|uniref:2-keto-3-deoxygluconate permease n=1 Tax=Megasphaera hominis TaxID=159836 RepID=A0ABR6VL16_9FIRM|nr:2-keto-3-deoxygluconate permease [Megasphaera hominis]MBC3537427.1 2-keto-3-deoxygluconate permease [Megasphaera hominis]